MSGGRWYRTIGTEYLASRHPPAGEVVAHRQRQQNEQPEQAADHDRRCQALTVAHVHEEQRDEHGLEHGDAERRHRVE
jgi:hypothetical protein